jgi:hypothetical protein
MFSKEMGNMSKLTDWIYRIVNIISIKYLKSRKTYEKYMKVLELIRPVSVIDSRFILKRVGSSADGGYIVPELFLQEFDSLYSAGIGENNDFEFEMSKNQKVFQFDHTIKVPPKSNSNMFFEPKGISKKVSTNFVTLDIILETETNLLGTILKLDIEGSEFDALKYSQNWDRVGALLIEIHQLQKFVLGVDKNKYESVLDRLLANFICLHVHANNCCGFFEGITWRLPKIVELTLVNKALLHEIEITPNHLNFPISLDRPNLPGVPDLYLGNLYSSNGIGSPDI